MIKTEQIPDEAAIAHCGGDILGLDMSDPEEVKYREAAIWNAKVNIADALNAWPDAKHMTADTLRAFSVPAIILPLTQESGNE